MAKINHLSSWANQSHFQEGTNLYRHSKECEKAETLTKKAAGLLQQ